VGESLGVTIVDWIAGCGLVYATLFGIGKIVLGNVGTGVLYLAVATLCGTIIAYNLIRTEREIVRTQRATV
jgi:TM2 domain-containing membrane protein YozV